MIRVTSDQTSYTAELSSLKSCLYKDAFNKYKPIRVKIFMHFKSRNLGIKADNNTTCVVIQIIT